MKHLKLSLVIITIFAIAVSMTSCKFFKEFTVDEMEDLFYENESVFSNAATCLHEIIKDSELTIRISKTNEYADSSNERMKVRQIKDLYFITVDYVFTNEEYKAMYDCVEPLFSSNFVKNRIYGCKSYIKFGINFHNGYDEALFFTEEDYDLVSNLYAVEDHKHFAPNWHAVVVWF